MVMEHGDDDGDEAKVTGDYRSPSRHASKPKQRIRWGRRRPLLLLISPPPPRLLHLRLVWWPYQGEVVGREEPSKHQGEVEGRGWPSKHQGNRNVWPPVNAREVVCAREAAAKGKRK